MKKTTETMEIFFESIIICHSDLINLESGKEDISTIFQIIWFQVEELKINLLSLPNPFH
jgi:hypothetical protein